MSRRRLFVPFAIAALLLSACGGGDAEATPPAYAPLVLTGAVDHPGSVTMAQLQALAPVTQTVSFGSGPQTHTYTGASLWSLLDQAGIQVDAARHNDVLARLVVATGADGYRAVFSLGELKPDFGNRPSVVAYAETASGVSGVIAAEGPLRVTAPGDVKGGRYVSNLVRLEVRASGAAASASAGGPSTTLAVSGAVQRPASLDLAALQALPAVTQTVGANTYVGASLWDLLNTTTGLVTRPAVKNDGLGLYVVATGSDGYRAVIALGELDPGFGNQPVIVAWQQNGAPLGSAGFARLVVPGDTKAGRSVSNLVALEVLAVP